MPRRTLPPGIRREGSGYRDTLTNRYLSERRYRAEVLGHPIVSDVKYNYPLRAAAERYKTNWKDKRSVEQIMKDSKVIEARKTIIAENKKLARILRKPYPTAKDVERGKELQPSATSKLGKAIEVFGKRQHGWDHYRMF